SRRGGGSRRREEGQRQRLYVRRNPIQLSQAIGQRLFVARREQRRGQDQIGDAIAEPLEGGLRRVAEHELGAQPPAHHRGQVVDLPPVGFDRQDQRHGFHTRNINTVRTVAASTKITSVVCIDVSYLTRENASDVISRIRSLASIMAADDWVRPTRVITCSRTR